VEVTASLDPLVFVPCIVSSVNMLVPRAAVGGDATSPDCVERVHPNSKITGNSMTKYLCVIFI
jgi:hypothetical protein